MPRCGSRRRRSADKYHSPRLPRKRGAAHRGILPQDSGGARWQRKDALEIVLEDHGTAVNRKKLCGRALEDVRPGGLGLHFIRECMDTVEFNRRNGRNQLRLVKILDVQGPEKGS